MVEYRELRADELCLGLFQGFIRRQEVTKCWRKEGQEWVTREVPFIDDWTKEDYKELIGCLEHTLETGGVVYAAFCDGILKGFASAEPGLFGGEQKYLDLSHIYVSQDMRGTGIGASLFSAAKGWAKQNGARKLYISAHSAIETQAFYQAMGCVHAKIFHQGHVEKEPFDCQLECVL